MKTKTTLIVSIALAGILTAPASARIEGDEGGASAYPRFRSERSFVAPSHYLINRPFQQR
jgi:hypothetical protein